jgi:hypothetical protein
MSEYQYYEFQALDRPLSNKDMSALRRITSRAEITPTSLINEYHFGDFSGDPDKLMDKYFDAFLYFANWGTHRLMLRLPRPVFELAAAKPYTVPYTFRARATKEHGILDFVSEDESGDYYDEVMPTLASVIPLRSDLLNGDLRCLYLAWLAAAKTGELDEDEPEPPVPPGLDKLSGSLKKFADFLRVDADLIEVAASASSGQAPVGPTSDELAAWVAALPDMDKNAMLLRAMQGDAAYLGSELLQRMRQDRAHARTGPHESAQEGGRTIKELLRARDIRTEEKARRKARRQAKS